MNKNIGEGSILSEDNIFSEDAGKNMADSISIKNVRGRVTVIVPVYNAEASLRKCLSSICGQTHGDLEILLIDDGSTDSSLSICREYADKDPRVQVFHKDNGGVSSARNLGLKHISGEFVSFVDADDWLEPDMIERMADCPGSADMVICEAYYHMRDGSVQMRLTGPKEGPVDHYRVLEEYFLRGNFGRGLWNKLFRYTLIEGFSFDEKLKYYEDSLFVTRALLKAESVYYCPMPLYNYRYTDEFSASIPYDSYKTSVEANKKICRAVRAYVEEQCGRSSLNRGLDWILEAVMYNQTFMVINTCRRAYLCRKRKEAAGYRRQAAELCKRVAAFRSISFIKKMKLVLAIISPVHGVNVWLRLKKKKHG